MSHVNTTITMHRTNYVHRLTYIRKNIIHSFMDHPSLGIAPLVYKQCTPLSINIYQNQTKFV